VAMDYIRLSEIIRYPNFETFLKKNIKSRIILFTTKSKKLYYQFKFKKNDFLLFGRESAGVPEEIHKKVKDKLKVPLSRNTRSLNVAMTVAIVASEALVQNNFFK
jgi:tRNA (cytidine/uridine-2'-O-)-methyltransferase